MTKDGTLAGPRVLEHMVDLVLHLESQESGGFRVLRAAKNRFGSTDEIGVFLMGERGLADVPDPSRALISQRTAPQLGAIATPSLEGSRALLLEVQALTNFSQLQTPRRVANGVDYNRLLMLTAVASRRTGLELERAGRYRKRGRRIPRDGTGRRPGHHLGHRLLLPECCPAARRGFRRGGVERRTASRAPSATTGKRGGPGWA